MLPIILFICNRITLKYMYNIIIGKQTENRMNAKDTDHDLYLNIMYKYK